MWYGEKEVRNCVIFTFVLFWFSLVNHVNYLIYNLIYGWVSSIAVAVAVSEISVSSSNFAQILLERENFSHPRLGVNSKEDFIIHLFLVRSVGER